MAIPAEAWAQMDEINLKEELLLRVPTCINVPAMCRGRATAALIAVSEELANASIEDHTSPRASRAWKVFILMWRMLLRRTNQGGELG